MGTDVTVIGLAGRAGSGKSTVAKILSESYGVFVCAFAHKLKRVAGDLYDLSEEQLCGSLKEVVDDRWDLTPRAILQRFATEVARSVHDETWIRAVAREIDERTSQVIRFNDNRLKYIDSFAIEDTRFDNEADFVLSYPGGVLWEIRGRESALTDASHASERGLDWSRVPESRHVIIDNTGTIDDLKEQVARGLLHQELAQG